jgi:hypothetical protein
VTLYRNLTGLEILEYFTALAASGGYSRGELRSFFGAHPAESVRVPAS